jgi:HEPN domain-containing protein
MTVVRLSAESEFRDIVGFHAQQAAEKYLKDADLRGCRQKRRHISAISEGIRLECC